MVEITISLITERKLGFKTTGGNNSNTKEIKNQSGRVFFVSFLKSTLLLKWYYPPLWRTFSMNPSGFVVCGSVFGGGKVFDS